MNKENKNTFDILSAIDCSEYVEKKGNLTYLSWAWAWGITKKNFPDANYEVINFDGKPYLFDENLGYMVQTKVTISGEVIPMHLPLLDYRNKAMKENATMFDINTSIMRCLTKNLAMFGLGHYLYAGEDAVRPISKSLTIDEIKEAAKKCKSKMDLTRLYNQNKPNSEELSDYFRELLKELE